MYFLSKIRFFTIILKDFASTPAKAGLGKSNGGVAYRRLWRGKAA